MGIDSRIYVTGANGMLGRNLVDKLKGKGYRKIMHAPGSKVFDLRNRKAVFDFFEKNKPEYVFHLAARVGGIKANMKNPVEFLRDNLIININIIDACFKFKVRKLINLGSSCIYPKCSKQPMSEEDLLDGKLEPTNEGYAISKIASLRLCEYYNKQEGTNFISLMPPNLYGKYEEFNLESSHVISALIMRFHDAKVSGDERISIWGTGKARREFFYVEDAAESLIFAMENLKVGDLFEGCFLNCGSGKDISIKELAEMICEVVGFEGEIVYDSSKPEGMLKKLMDSRRFRKLSSQKVMDLKEGIEKTYQYYLETI